MGDTMRFRVQPVGVTVAVVIGLCLAMATPTAALPASSLTIDSSLGQQAYLKASNTSAADGFGRSVAISGDTAVVGAPFEEFEEDPADNSGSGRAYVFARNNATWTQAAWLIAPYYDSYDNFGWSVAISGDTIVVGAPYEDSSATGVNGDPSNNDLADSGAAYVFVRSGSTWSFQAYLKPSVSTEEDQFGWSVAISGDTIVVGAPGEEPDPDSARQNSGAAYVFARSGTTWSEQAWLKAPVYDAYDNFGFAVAISTDTIAVGAPGEDSDATGVGGDQTDNDAEDSGAAYAYIRSDGPWPWAVQAYLKASNTTAHDAFGYSVAISDDTIIVGAPTEEVELEPLVDTGSAYAFNRTGSTWSQQAWLKAPFNYDSYDRFGYSVAISGDAVVVGGPGEDSGDTGVGADWSNNEATDSGAAYVGLRSGSTWSWRDYVKASNTGAGDSFGSAVAISGDSIVVGAPEEDSDGVGVDSDQSNNDAPDAGAGYIFYESGCLSSPFTDVAIAHPFCAEIKWMKVNGISTGFTDGTYRPSIDVTRQAMSAFMARLAAATLAECTEEPFTDVPVTHPFCPEINWMKHQRISTGFDDETYRPSIDVTRQAMSAFMARLAGAEPAICIEAPFTDVPPNHPFCPEITWMKENGISTGFNDGTYRPTSDVTRQAMSAFMQRVSPLLP